jgi:G3E family GTPase
MANYFMQIIIFLTKTNQALVDQLTQVEAECDDLRAQLEKVEADFHNQKIHLAQVEADLEAHQGVHHFIQHEAHHFIQHEAHHEAQHEAHHEVEVIEQ